MDEKKLPISVELGASAKAEFKAEIKGEVPSSSLGRLVDAFTDAFRPFTERQGLKADQIRLQREDVLIEIARRAKRRLDIEGSSLHPIPLKSLVPLLEKASLETLDDDEMLDRWATLLAEESGNPGPNRRWITEVLSELNGWQARILEDVARAEPAREFFRVENYTRPAADERFQGVLVQAENKGGLALERAISELKGFTLWFDAKDIPNTNEFEFKDISEGPDLLHLDAVGLLWVNAGSFVGITGRHFVLNARLTPLGFQFAEMFISGDTQS